MLAKLIQRTNYVTFTGNPVGCKQSGSSASEPDVIITGIEPSSSRVKNSSHSATPAQGELVSVLSIITASVWVGLADIITHCV